MKHLCLLLLRLYRMILSPLLGSRCRFYPSCSHYSAEAIEIFGVLKGAKLTVYRLLKCHPWHPGGWDPVLEKEKSQL